VAAPTSDDLAVFTGAGSDFNYDQAEVVIQVVTALASAYTRGQGFANGEPKTDIRAVILSASARLMVDTTQIVEENKMGPFSITYRHTDGWTVWELATLNRYRQRAM
jgi:hypothetical protein